MNRLIQYASLRPTPWKNGGGVTTELAMSPPGAGIDDFDWRVSLASIAEDGPFSQFPGVDRTLVMVAGDGVLLDFGDERVVLSPSEPLVEFAGEDPVHATISGPMSGQATLDFNVMTRRGRYRHRIEPFVVCGSVPLPRRSGTTLVFLADGESLSVCSARERLALVRYDLLVLDGEQAWTLESAQATVFVVDLIAN